MHFASAFPQTLHFAHVQRSIKDAAGRQMQPERNQIQSVQSPSDECVVIQTHDLAFALSRAETFGADGTNSEICRHILADQSL